MILVALIAFLAGIAVPIYPCYRIHKRIVKELDAEWQRIINYRFKQIPKSYHEAWESGWQACQNSEVTVKLQYEKFFGKPIHHERA